MSATAEKEFLARQKPLAGCLKKFLSVAIT
jgi:hypothetical protein